MEDGILATFTGVTVIDVPMYPITTADTNLFKVYFDVSEVPDGEYSIEFDIFFKFKGVRRMLSVKYSSDVKYGANV